MVGGGGGVGGHAEGLLRLGLRGPEAGIGDVSGLGSWWIAQGGAWRGTEAGRRFLPPSCLCGGVWGVGWVRGRRRGDVAVWGATSGQIRKPCSVVTKQGIGTRVLGVLVV